MELMSDARRAVVYNHVYGAIGELTWVDTPDPDENAQFTFNELVAAVQRRCNDPRYGHVGPVVTAGEVRHVLNIEPAEGELLELMYDEETGGDLVEVAPDVFRPGPGYVW